MTLFPNLAGLTKNRVVAKIIEDPSEDRKNGYCLQLEGKQREQKGEALAAEEAQRWQEVEAALERLPAQPTNRQDSNIQQ